MKRVSLTHGVANEIMRLQEEIIRLKATLQVETRATVQAHA